MAGAGLQEETGFDRHSSRKDPLFFVRPCSLQPSKHSSFPLDELLYSFKSFALDAISPGAHRLRSAPGPRARADSLLCRFSRPTKATPHSTTQRYCGTPTTDTDAPARPLSSISSASAPIETSRSRPRTSCARPTFGLECSNSRTQRARRRHLFQRQNGFTNDSRRSGVAGWSSSGRPS